TTRGPRTTPLPNRARAYFLCPPAAEWAPAEVRLMPAKALFVSQAMLTGESIPVEKHPVLPTAKPATPRGVLELETACFMGTNVVSGAATAVVVATGDATYFGAIARDIARGGPLTTFDIGTTRGR